MSYRLVRAILVTALLVAGCGGSPEVELAVDLQTDLEPGVDFVTARVAVHASSGPDGSSLLVERAIDSLEPSYRTPERLLELSGVGAGERLIVVRLLAPDGAVTAARRVRVTVEQTRRVVVVIQSQCAGVTCPSEGGDPRATECLNGVCVQPACTTGEQPQCPEGVECASDADCDPAVACAEGRCEAEVCVGEAVSSRCGTDGRCDLREGCVGGASMDGGPDDAGPPSDAGPSDAGRGDGGDGGPACTDAGCDDGIACTDDACGPDGSCVHTPDDGSCTAGPGGTCDPALGCQYDSCTEATCTPTNGCQTASCVGDTCRRQSTCSTDESCCAGSCVPTGCDDGLACTTDVCGASGCVHTPNDGACDDSNPCTADTCDPPAGCRHADEPEGATCGPTSCGSYGPCQYSGPCDESGTQERTCTDRVCNSGTCTDSTYVETRGCSRTTDGDGCGTLSCGACSYSNVCDESGSQDCTDPTCSDGSCVDVATMRGCTRDTDGTSCTGVGVCFVYECASGVCSQVGDTCGPGSRCCAPCVNGCKPTTESCMPCQ